MDAEGPLRPSLLSVLGAPSFLMGTCCRHASSHGLGEEQSGRCSCDILSKKGGHGRPGRRKMEQIVWTALNCTLQVRLSPRVTTYRKAGGNCVSLHAEL